MEQARRFKPQKPIPEGVQIFSGKLLNGTLNFQYTAHGVKIRAEWVTGNPGRKFVVGDLGTGTTGQRFQNHHAP